MHKQLKPPKTESKLTLSSRALFSCRRCLISSFAWLKAFSWSLTSRESDCSSLLCCCAKSKQSKRERERRIGAYSFEVNLFKLQFLDLGLELLELLVHALDVKLQLLLDLQHGEAG